LALAVVCDLREQRTPKSSRTNDTDLLARFRAGSRFGRAG
jgi:hypothetical protein